MKKSLAHIEGVVAKFKGNGRKLGYPTANVRSATSLQDGVYFAFANLSKYKNHPSIVFIGTPTTLGDTERRVEAYLLDIPDQDYYDQTLALDVQHFHRPHQTFDSIDELLIAMKADEVAARQWFKAHTPRTG